MVDLSDFSNSKDFLEFYVKSWQYTKTLFASFVDKCYKIKDVVFPKPVLFEFVVEQVLLFESKDYTLKKNNITGIKDFTKTLSVQSLGGNVDKGDFVEVRCRMNGEKIRLISDTFGCLNIWQALFYSGNANELSRKKRFYCEMKCEVTKETKDVSEKIHEYFRGGTILKEVRDEGGYHFIECSKILERVLRVPKKNSNVQLSIIEI